MHILGLDISTSVVGISILDENKKIIVQEAVILNSAKHKKLNKYEKATILQIRFQELKKKYDIDYVFIEDRLSNVNSRVKNLKVIAMLIEFNGIVSWIVREIFNKDPIHLHPSSARKLAGFKKDAKSEDDIKIQIVNFLLDKAPQFVVDYTKFDNIQKHYYDIADAIVVAMGGIQYLKKLGVLK